MLRKVLFLALVASTAAYADKPATSDILKKASTTSVETEETAGTILDLNTSESHKILTTLKSNEDVLKNYTPLGSRNIGTSYLKSQITK